MKTISNEYKAIRLLRTLSRVSYFTLKRSVDVAQWIIS